MAINGKTFFLIKKKDEKYIVLRNTFIFFLLKKIIINTINHYKYIYIIFIIMFVSLIFRINHIEINNNNL